MIDDMPLVRTHRAGSAIEDYCRACKADRMHTVVVADVEGRPLRVMCGYCRSEHNYRGGPRQATDSPAAAAAAEPEDRARLPVRRATAGPSHAAPAPRAPFPLVSERERTAPAIMLPDVPMTDLESLLRRVIREEAGVSAVTPA